ncbi:MAG: CidA/LrgA family protein [Bacillota bacterium]|uniref:Holin-like protein n=1 Tax=[Clostridium] aminophilum TaxID=1526 RepID=A0A1I6JLZ1_9FIRM|nr:CidA/LrgA family protein [[Clostridium] aminophilum]MDT3844820.1 CidA/LrgA family protein [Bacillota bacterium]SFR79996.1 holin-like protein [[Clostridium] aminophilum]
MKYMKQFGVILATTCVGEFLHYFIPLSIPGSIYGLVLMFILLMLHVIPLEDVKETAEFLIEIMPVMFIPAAVGLLESWDQLRPIVIPVLVITVFSTFLVMVVTGKVTEFVIHHTHTAGKKDKSGKEGGMS